LGLRDLQALLAGPFEKVITERSHAALDEARELAPVFVKTRAYQKALNQLLEHGLVVLDGPPEVGKTAIARTIGLAMATTGWEFVECRWPEDVLQKFKSSEQQVFIVDDALGRTEYHASYGLRWETELPTVLRKVDRSHWLIWTSRKHILVHGLERMDLTERSRTAISAAATPVDASVLSELERARMLYRHAKAKKLSTPVKRLLRRRARRVIDNKKFTPERLRRLIDDVAKNGVEYVFDRKRFDEAIRSCLNTASDSMRQVFKAFPETPRWILVVAAELGERPSEQRLYQRLQAHRPLLSNDEFVRHLDMLDGTFIKRMKVDGRDSVYAGIDWVHPSYRDVVIEFVHRDWELQAQFWKNASPKALGLAFSEAGGEKGELSWAWASCPAVFEDIERVLLRVVNEHALPDAEKVMSILAGATRTVAPSKPRQRLSELMPRVLEAIENRWRNAQHIPSLRELTLRGRLCRAHDLPMPVGYVKAGWLDERQSLQGRDGNYEVEAYSVERWLDWVQLLDSVVPELWREAGITALLLDDIEAIRDMFECEAEIDVEDIEPEYLQEEKDRIEQLFNAAETFYQWTDQQSALEVDDTPYHELNERKDALEQLLEPEEEYESTRRLQGSLELSNAKSKDTVEGVMRDL